MIPYYRCSSKVSLQTAENNVQTVTLDQQPVDLNEAQKHIVDFLLKFPDSSFDEIMTALVMMTAKPYSAQKVTDDLDDLCHREIASCRSSEPRIAMPYPIDHTCEMCGCSCMAQLVGPLSDEEHQNAIDAHKDLPESAGVPKDVNPIMKGLKPDGSCLYFLNFPGKRCIFLDKDHKCTIHGNFGAAKKPAACRRFPIIAIRTESEIRIGIKPYCYANFRCCDLNPSAPNLIETYRKDPQMAETLDDLIQNAAFRPVIRINDPEEALQARIQETQITSWLQSDMNYASLLASLAKGTQTKLDKLPKPFIQDVQKAFRALSGMLAQEAEKLGTTAHARHARELCECLNRPVSESPLLAEGHAFARYVKYALFEAVFLRETSRFPAVSLGTFGLALGALAAAQDPDKASDHLTVWMRLFAQTQAFAMLFPTPQAMSALMRHL
ncbi:MAG: YkgJ family cysteine cluster protein [Proteobacteria bacterium]|nr:YkgJ family cysteine cluster protein [Pseudomonadota bacterium]